MQIIQSCTPIVITSAIMIVSASTMRSCLINLYNTL
jgi:hypothetical protein